MSNLLAQTKANIVKYGLQVIMVQRSEYQPSFAYSIGLFETYKQPEIICFGLPDTLGHAIINDVAALMKNGEVIQPYTNYNNVFKNSRAEFLPVEASNIACFFGAALNYYQELAFPALQLVWTDRKDLFPWEPGFEEEFRYEQPLLDRNADFKFSEPDTLAVFTTRQWIEDKKPILHVVHAHDGSWQFLTGDQLPDDIRTVALNEMVSGDKTLNELFNLDYGQAATREFVGGKWKRNNLPTEDEQ